MEDIGRQNQWVSLIRLQRNTSVILNFQFLLNRTVEQLCDHHEEGFRHVFRVEMEKLFTQHLLIREA